MKDPPANVRAVQEEFLRLFHLMLGPPDMTWDVLTQLTPGQLNHLVETGQEILAEVELKTTPIDDAGEPQASGKG
jgi:hypothetical protein